MIGWIVIFYDPDGLEIHLYSREHHGQDISEKPGRRRPVQEQPASSGDA